MNSITQLLNKIFRAFEQLEPTSALILVCCVVVLGAICMRGFGGDLR